MAANVLNSILLSKVIILTLLVILKRTPYIDAFTHWVVTEEGKIQAQVKNTMYIINLFLILKNI